MGFRDVVDYFHAETYIALEQIWETGSVVFQKHPDGTVRYHMDIGRAPRYLRHFVREVMNMETSAPLEMVVTMSGMCEGLKVIALNHMDAQSLENTSVNIALEDYDQPFPTVFVDLPAYFGEKHVVDCLQAGQMIAGKPQVERHHPHCVGVRFQKKDDLCFMVVSVYFTSCQVYSALIDTSVGETLEEAINNSFTPDLLTKSTLNGTQEGYDVCRSALRTALNTLLILEGEGIRKIGPRDPRHYKKLEDNLAKARKRRDTIEKQRRAEQLLKSEPIYYSFDQNVVLYHREENPSQGESGEGLRGSVRPHWRRGYWRMQAFGVGNSQRKRIRIPPVLVNKDRFLGHTRDTQVTYTN